MVIVRISNGLGNQLFQYALGRSLAIKNNTELVLDVSSFNQQKTGDAFRHYTLDHFNVAGRFATKNDFKQIGITDPNKQDFFTKARKKMKQSLESGKPIHERKVITEPSFTFIPDILNVDHDCYLIGIWQSEKYFEEIKPQIIKDFTLKAPFSKNAEILKQKIMSGNSVAIHVRRGDQVSDPRLAKKHGVLTDEYYSSAVAYIKEKTTSPRFFVFSDEIEWVKKNLNLGENVTYVSDHGLADYEELIIMSLCKHTIVAKSSYSWWGAWLNQNPEKIVITPKNRFGKPGNDEDLIPSDWVRL